MSHELAERGFVPESYRDTFVQAAEQGLIPVDLAAQLANAAGLRNVSVHLYEDIDYEIVTTSIDEALRDFGRFLQLYSARLEEAQAGDRAGRRGHRGGTESGGYGNSR